jgi:hypothetical protein
MLSDWLLHGKTPDFSFFSEANQVAQRRGYCQDGTRLTASEKVGKKA